MASNPATPILAKAKVHEENNEFIPEVVKSIRDLKSPQVDFSALKHARPSPQSGRGACKKKKDVPARKKLGLAYNIASPSDLFARSMLSFDLDPKVDDENYIGENELFVKFHSDRRRSTGRGTLQTLINKRIALQASGQVLAQRQQKQLVEQTVEKPVLDASPVQVPPPVGKQKRQKKKKDQYDLEIPLGQDFVFDNETQQDTVLVSQQDTLLVSQTQIYVRHEEEDEEEEGKDGGDQEEEEQDEEEQDEEENKDHDIPEKNLDFLPTPLKFLDLEASESDEDNNESNDDDSRSNVSDLIGSDHSEDSNGFNHFQLHQKWQQEEEEKEGQRGEEVKVMKTKSFLRELFVPKKIFPKLMNENKTKVIFENASKELSAAQEVTIKKTRVDFSKEVSAQEVSIGRETVAKFVKKFPNRRSSVSSSCSDIKVVRVSKTEGVFSFLPVVEEQVVHEDIPTGQRLMGTKRFVFGNVS